MLSEACKVNITKCCEFSDELAQQVDVLECECVCVCVRVQIRYGYENETKANVARQCKASEQQAKYKWLKQTTSRRKRSSRKMDECQLKAQLITD